MLPSPCCSVLVEFSEGCRLLPISSLGSSIRLFCSSQADEELFAGFMSIKPLISSVAEREKSSAICKKQKEYCHHRGTSLSQKDARIYRFGVREELIAYRLKCGHADDVAGAMGWCSLGIAHFSSLFFSSSFQVQTQTS